MSGSILQSPSVQLAGDSTRVLNYKLDPQNYITQLFGEQLPAISNGFFNVHMTKGVMITPHWHTNAEEMIFVISGEVISSVFNPFTQRLMTYCLKPGQVSLLPKGWFHWIITESDHAHVLAIFDQPTPDVVYGADFLRCTPKEVMQRAYCINEEDYAKAVAPIKEAAVLGPPLGCCKEPADKSHTLPHPHPNAHAYPYGHPFSYFGGGYGQPYQY